MKQNINNDSCNVNNDNHSINVWQKQKQLIYSNNNNINSKNNNNKLLRSSWATMPSASTAFLGEAFTAT